jgi:thiamine kinase-like enzyme
MDPARSSKGQNERIEPELATVVAETLRLHGGEAFHIASKQKFARKTKVWRLQIERDGEEIALFAKLLSARDSRITTAVAYSWLPRAGLERYAAPLLGVSSANPQGRVWHLYKDLGDCTLERVRVRSSDRVHGNTRRGFLSPQPLGPVMDRAQAAVVALARLHRTFANHQMLDECRSLSQDLGVVFLETNVRNASRRLEKLGSSAWRLAQHQEDTRNRLLEHLGQLEREIPGRSAEIVALGGPHTLLHGDMHGGNVLVYRDSEDWSVRFIDWVLTGVGPVSYDLSNLLLHYDPQDRRTILDWYAATAAPDGLWRTDAEWNAIFDTAERSRLACSVAWLTEEALKAPSDWVFEELAAVENWFALLTPVLIMGGERTRADAPSTVPAASQ